MPTLLQRAQALTISMETLAALGALLTLRRSGDSADPQVSALLSDIVATIDPDLLANTTPAEEAVTLGFIRAFMAQASDLLGHPSRPPGWTHTDPAILTFYGNASRQVVVTLAQLAGDQSWLGDLLNNGGRFLDIGTGVGMIAIDVAIRWPAMSVVGIDISDAPLALARTNVAASGAAERIELRRQGVEELSGSESFDLVWFPGPFIPRPIVEPSLRQLRERIRQGGALVFGLFGAPNPTAQLLTDLRTVRNGGHPWRVDDVRGALEAAGFSDVISYAEGSLATLVVGRA